MYSSFHNSCLECYSSTLYNHPASILTPSLYLTFTFFTSHGCTFVSVLLIVHLSKALVCPIT